MARQRGDAEVYGDDGSVQDERAADFLRGFMEEFSTHVERVLTVIPR